MTDYQPQILNALNAAIAFGNKLAEDKNIIDRQVVIDSGEEIIRQLTVDERETWTDAILPVWESFEDEIGTTLIQAVCFSTLKFIVLDA